MTPAILSVDDLLIVSIPTDLKDREAERLQNDLLEHVQRTRAKGVILDLTAVEIVDSYLGRLLRDTAAMLRLMGTESVVVGLQPAVAITLVELGLDLPVSHTDLNLGRGLQWLKERV